jgi:S-adenosylmethionine/arginine decarboxylase-like enzyme
MSWGYHTIINLKQCNPVLIRSEDAIQSYIHNIVKLLDMRAFGNPLIVLFGESKEVAGYTFVQLIETSHISGHFVNDNNAAYIDIFSCREYDSYDAAHFTAKFFGSKDMFYQLIERV